VKISIKAFNGERPKLSSRNLRDDMAETAVNARLVSTDLEAYRDLTQEAILPKGPPVTFWLMASEFWLHWTSAELNSGAVMVDVARGAVPGDSTYRTFLTGVENGPRFTNLFYATDESVRHSYQDEGAYPYLTFRLGVDPPTEAPDVTGALEVTTPDNIVKTYDGSDISDWATNNYVDNSQTKQWEVSTGYGDGAVWLSTLGHADDGKSILYQVINLPVTVTAFSYAFKCKIEQANNTESSLYIGLFQPDANSDGGARIVLSNESGNNRYADGTGSSESFADLNFEDHEITVTVTGTEFDEDTDYFTVDIVLSDGTTTVTLSDKRLKKLGDMFSFYHLTDPNPDQASILWVDGLSYSFTPALSEEDAPVFSNYVYTLVTRFGEESAPSDPSDDVEVDNGGTVTIVIPEPANASEISEVRLYRAATGATGTVYQLVDISNYVAFPMTFYDSKRTVELGDVLVTVGYDIPPADLHSIIALPNGIMAGLSGNQLCLSAQNAPYAWPVAYRLTIDTIGIALGAIDTTVLVLTQAHPYTAWGATPDAFSMSKEISPQGCVSKRSVAFLRGQGVVYASANGLVAYSGQGRAPLITREFFTFEQWTALNPPSILGIAHDDRYFFWYEKTNGDKGGYVLDASENGFGLIELDFHATAAYVDPLTDILYVNLDEGSTKVLAPGHCEVPSVAGQTDLSTDVVYPWAESGLTNELPVSGPGTPLQKLCDDRVVKIIDGGDGFFYGITQPVGLDIHLIKFDGTTYTEVSRYTITTTSPLYSVVSFMFEDGAFFVTVLGVTAGHGEAGIYRVVQSAVDGGATTGNAFLASTPDRFTGAVVIDDSIWVASEEAKTLIELDPADLTELSTVDVASLVTNPSFAIEGLATDDVSLYVSMARLAGTAGAVAKITAGVLDWERNLTTAGAGRIQVVGGRVFVYTDYYTVTALNASTGAIVGDVAGSYSGSTNFLSMQVSGSLLVVQSTRAAECTVRFIVPATLAVDHEVTHSNPTLIYAGSYADVAFYESVEAGGTYVFDVDDEGNGPLSDDRWMALFDPRNPRNEHAYRYGSGPYRDTLAEALADAGADGYYLIGWSTYLLSAGDTQAMSPAFVVDNRNARTLAMHFQDPFYVTKGRDGVDVSLGVPGLWLAESGSGLTCMLLQYLLKYGIPLQTWWSARTNKDVHADGASAGIYTFEIGHIPGSYYGSCGGPLAEHTALVGSFADVNIQVVRLARAPDNPCAPVGSDPYPQFCDSPDVCSIDGVATRDLEYTKVFGTYQTLQGYGAAVLATYPLNPITLYGQQNQAFWDAQYAADQASDNPQMAPGMSYAPSGGTGAYPSIVDHAWERTFSTTPVVPATDDEIGDIDADPSAIYSWNTYEFKRPYEWRSKLYLLPRGTAFNICRVKADDYDDLTLTLYMEGAAYLTETVTSDFEFVIPDQEGRNFQLKLEGTSRVQSVEVCEHAEELE
jgi:hypothetical protein